MLALEVIIGLDLTDLETLVNLGIEAGNVEAKSKGTKKQTYTKLREALADCAKESALRIKRKRKPV